MEACRAYLHGSGDTDSGAGVGHTSSPEQMLERRLYETSDEMSVRPSSRHDGSHGSRPHGGHHDVVLMSTKGGSANGDECGNMTMPRLNDDWGQGGDHR